MKKRIITISRQNGSGGRYIGERLAKELGITCYDEKLMDMVAKESGFALDFVEEKGERITGSLLFNIASSLTYANNVFTGNGVSLQDEIYFIQNRIIKDIAEKESCVIVGRCADYVLKEYDNVCNVFIQAAMSFRIDRAVNQYNDNEKSVADIIVKNDKRRSNYYNYHVGEKWTNLNNYDLVIRSDLTGIDTAVACICAYLGK